MSRVGKRLEALEQTGPGQKHVRVIVCDADLDLEQVAAEHGVQPNDRVLYIVTGVPRSHDGPVKPSSSSH